MRLIGLFFPLCFLFNMPAPNKPLVRSVKSSIVCHEIQQYGNIKIGLLINNNTSLAAKQGAEMAIREANEKGGYGGKSFQLVVRSMEGPWGTGSKAAVSMIFEEEVCAIIGSHDGRNAHLVEQVSAKARIVFISAWATDPTLSQAFVPWYFSCVPNDLQQADELVREIYKKRKLTDIAAVSDNDYDAKMAVSSFKRKTRETGNPDPQEFVYDKNRPDFNLLIEQINKARANAIILFGQPENSSSLIKLMRQRKMEQPVFGFLSVTGDNNRIIQELAKFDNIILITSGLGFITSGQAFGDAYRQLYDRFPDAVSAYAYDGMNVIIETIRKNGTDGENIQKALLNTSFAGATGMIHFDEKGNRTGKVFLMEIRNGRPVYINTK